ncbi:hypothetical protein EDB89DRAFT_2076958 [Lactarius sanguifluus]|nr:hypothetical protein EDB89DRAFT_2076958 [Lactarius sanguifluus]
MLLADLLPDPLYPFSMGPASRRPDGVPVEEVVRGREAEGRQFGSHSTRPLKHVCTPTLPPRLRAHEPTSALHHRTPLPSHRVQAELDADDLVTSRNATTIVVAWLLTNDETTRPHHSPRKHACKEDEATQYLAAYKQSEHRPPTLICERIFKTPAVLRTVFMSTPRLNRTNFEALHLQPLVPGIHLPTSVPPQIRLEKVTGLKDAFKQPFCTGMATTTTSPLLPCGLAAAQVFTRPPPPSSRIVHSYHPSVGLKKRPGVPQLPDLKFRREEKRLRHSVRAETIRPVPTTGKYDDGTEPTLSSLACLVAMHGVSPAVSEMPSIGSRKTKVQEGKAKEKRFYKPSAVREYLKRHDLNASLPLSAGRTSAQAPSPNNMTNIALAPISKRIHLPHHEVRNTGAPYICCPSRPSYSPTCPPTHSVRSSPLDPLHEDAIVTPEPTLSSLAWLAASATMYDIPSAVSEQASVVDAAHVFSTRARYARSGRGHSQLAEEERREVGSSRLAFVLNEVDPVPRENTQAFTEGPRPMIP